MTTKRNLLARTKRTVVLVEDHPIFRDGLAQLINQEDDLSVIGTADSADKAMDLIMEKKPDMVVVDIMLKDSSGIELLHEIRRIDRKMPVIVLSMHEEAIFVDRVLKAGARGYIVKRETTDRVIEAIRQVFSGRIYVSENLLDCILNRFVAGSNDPAASPVEALSDREFQVLNLIGQGLSNSRIAEMLSVSIKTVATYRERIKTKLNLKSAAELTRYAIRLTEDGENPSARRSQ